MDWRAICVESSEPRRRAALLHERQGSRNDHAGYVCADTEVKQNEPDCQLTESGAVTRRSKLTYLLRRHGVTADGVAAAVSEDVDNLLSLFRTFNDGTHGRAGRFDITELSAIRIRVEGAIRFVHTVVSVPA